MSKRLDVLKALKSLIAVAVAPAEVVGLDGDEAAPARVLQSGRVIVRSGDPGEPEVDLSPLAYNWSHRIPIELVAVAGMGVTAEEALDALLVRIGSALALDPTLGGLCDWVEAAAPATEDITNDGAAPPRGADLIITAIYVTSSPLN